MKDVDIQNYSRNTFSRRPLVSLLCGSLFIFVHKYGKRRPCRSPRFLYCLYMRIYFEEQFFVMLIQI